MSDPRTTVADLLAKFDAIETWRLIDDWPYEVSSWGNVRRLGKTVLLIPGAAHGYLHVTLSSGGTQKTVRIHKLVVTAFLGPSPFKNAQAAHNDGNQTNNRASNLRWASALENQRDRERHETKIVGSAVFGAKLTESDIPAIKARISRGERYPSIADDYGVSVSTISLISLGRTWRHVQPARPAQGVTA